MRKKIILLSFMVLSFMILRFDVFAAATASSNSSDEIYSTLKAQYDKGIQKVELSSNSQTITLYGKSECSGSSCKVSYAGGLTSFEEAIQKSASCKGGEKYVIYQAAGSGKDNFSSDNKANLSGTAYWSEDYQLTCCAEKTSDYTVAVDQTSNTTNNSNSGNSSNNSNTTNSSNTTSSSNSYSSSTTVKSPETGVNTYFIVLGIVALVSYVIMLFVKKFNLFKNI